MPVSAHDISIDLFRVLVEPYESVSHVRYICRLPAHMQEELDFVATSAIGLPLVDPPVIIRDVYCGDVREVEVSVTTKHRFYGLRLDVRCVHKGETYTARCTSSRSDLRNCFFAWMEERKNVSNWEEGYDGWLRSSRTSPEGLAAQRAECAAWKDEALANGDSSGLASAYDGTAGGYPLISIVTPVFRTPAAYLRTMIDSVLAQTYPNFELILVNVSGDCPQVDEVLRPYVSSPTADSRIRLVATTNKTIAENTNVGINISHGAYVCFIDHDDFIEPDTLYRYVCEIRACPEVDLLYCDEDMWTDEGDHFVGDIRMKRLDAKQPEGDVPQEGESADQKEIQYTDPKVGPASIGADGYFFGSKFKGEWDLDRLLDGNTICHMLMVSRRVLAATHRTPAEFTGAQDYDLTLKAAEIAREIRFVPHMLYHWRSHESSSATNMDDKNYLLKAGMDCVRGYLSRRGCEASLGEVDYPLMHRTYYALPNPRPKASVVVVAHTTGEAAACTTRILATTSYEDYEVVLVAPDEDILDLAAGRVRAVTASEDSSWTMRANFGCERAAGDVLVVVDGCVSNFSPGWLQPLVERLARPDVGIAAPLVLNTDGFVDSCGLTLQADGSAVRMTQNLHPRDTGYMQYLLATHTASAVSHACIAMRRETFEELGGLDERFSTGVSVAALCLRARECKLASVLVPYAPITWLEKKTLEEAEDAADDCALLVELWPGLRAADPVLDPNLDRTSPFYQLPAQRA